MSDVKIHNQPGFNKDQEDAKKQLDEKINEMVTVIVIHKPTNMSTGSKVTLKEVRDFAEQAINKFSETKPNKDGSQPKTGEFVVVEVGIDNPDYARVSNLEEI